MIRQPTTSQRPANPLILSPSKDRARKSATQTELVEVPTAVKQNTSPTEQQKFVYSLRRRQFVVNPTSVPGGVQRGPQPPLAQIGVGGWAPYKWGGAGRTTS